MSKRFTAFCQAVTYLMAFFIIMYTIKLAARYDPDLRPIELIVVTCTAMACFAGACWHMCVVITNQTVTDKEYK
jgi:hypothetical protein